VRNALLEEVRHLNGELSPPGSERFHLGGSTYAHGARCLLALYSARRRQDAQPE
jgi:hypothetical protein